MTGPLLLWMIPADFYVRKQHGFGCPVTFGIVKIDALVSILPQVSMKALAMKIACGSMEILYPMADVLFQQQGDELMEYPAH